MKNKKNAPVTEEKTEIYVYIGPTVRGVLQSGTVYRGKKSDIIGKIAEKYPQIERLTVKSSELAEARRKIQNGEGIIALAYKTLSEKMY